MSQTALMTLDRLGVSLADHGHVWTDEERALYESAVADLTASCGDYVDSGSSVSARSPRLKPSHKSRPQSARA